MILYHGTNQNFDTFKLDQPCIDQNGKAGGVGLYFYDNEYMASLFCFKDWTKLDSGFRDNAVVYKVEVELKNGLPMYPLEHSLNRIYGDHKKTKSLFSYYKMRGHDHVFIYESAIWEKYLAAPDMTEIDVCEYLCTQYCVFDPQAITILDKLQPKSKDELIDWATAVKELRKMQYQKYIN